MYTHIIDIILSLFLTTSPRVRWVVIITRTKPNGSGFPEWLLWLGEGKEFSTSKLQNQESHSNISTTDSKH